MQNKKEIFSKGFFIWRNYFGNDDLKEIAKMHRRAIKETKNPSKGYEGGKLARVNIKKKENLANMIGIENLKDKLKIVSPSKAQEKETYGRILKDIEELTFALCQKRLGEVTVFYTSDNIQTKHSAQKPHFDWRPCLKAMIYLDDCKKNNQGGLFICEGSHTENRIKLSAERLKRLTPGKEDANEYFRKSKRKYSEFTYCGGEAGDVLFFLTDNFHYQGKNHAIEFNRIARIHAYLDH